MNAPGDAAERAAPLQTLHVFQTTCRIVIPTAIIGLMIGACSGLIPPWPVVTMLSVGLIAGVTFVVAKKPAIAVAIALVTLVFCGWLLQPVVDIRATTPDDRACERYFGIDSYEANTGVTFRNIGVATGTFTLNTWMSASLYHVKGGEIQEINAFTVGRSPNQIGAPHWVDMKLTLALGDRETPKGRVTQLGSAGHSRGGGRGGDLAHDVVRSAAEFLPGRFSSGTKRILYVEGDQEFTLDSGMTVERFAQENKGNYLVVEVELH